MFASDMIRDDEVFCPDPVRRIISAAAPYPKDAARPADDSYFNIPT